MYATIHLNQVKHRTAHLIAACVAWILVTAIFSGTAYGDLLAYDPFSIGRLPALGNYAAGDEDAGTNLLGNQNPVIGPTAFYSGPWVQSGGDSQVVKALPSLSYPNFPAGIGGLQQETVQFDCCSFGRTARPITGGLGGGAARTIYESFLIDFGTQGGDNPAEFGFHGHELWNGGVGDSFRVVALFLNHFGQVPVNELSLRVETPGLGEVTVPVSGGGLTLDALAGVHLVVMKYEFNPIAPDVVSVYLDPPLDAEPNTADATISVPSSDLFITHQGAFSQFTFSGGSHIPGAIDEIRWGDTFSDVVTPEPAGHVLGALGLASVVAARRGRRRELGLR